MSDKPFVYAGVPVVFDDVAQSEHHIQTRFMVMCVDHEFEYPDLRFIFAVPNGGMRQRQTAIILKDEGVKRGVPDVCLPIPRGGFHGWWCEFKYSRNKPSEVQEDFIAFLRLQGFYVLVSWSASEAIKDLIAYLDLPADDEPILQHSLDCGKSLSCVPPCPIALAEARASNWPRPVPRLFQ